MTQNNKASQQWHVRSRLYITSLIWQRILYGPVYLELIFFHPCMFLRFLVASHTGSPARYWGVSFWCQSMSYLVLFTICYRGWWVLSCTCSCHLNQSFTIQVSLQEWCSTGSLAHTVKRLRALQNGTMRFGYIRPRGKTVPNSPDSQSRRSSENVSLPGQPIPPVHQIEDNKTVNL